MANSCSAHRRRSSSYDDWKALPLRYFRRWKLDGTWLRIHRYLRDWVRLHLSRSSSPSVAIIDSQSVKIGVLSNHSVGYDGGKNIKGRKRHVLVDTMGLVLMVVVTAANVSDQAGAKTLFGRLKPHKHWLKRLFLIYTDGTYRGETFMQWTFDTYDWILEAVLRTDRHKGFRVLPKRWVVERTLGWSSAYAQIVVFDDWEGFAFRVVSPTE